MDGTLRCLYPRQTIPVAQRDVEIIAIPGVGMSKPHEWTWSTENWLQKIASDCRGQHVQVLFYDYTVDESAEESVMHQLDNHGHSLLHCLKTHSGAVRDKLCPVLFVCHSLGGLILKKAVSIIRQTPFKYLEVTHFLAGIVFLGTPHISENGTANPNVIELILRTTQSKRLSRSPMVRSGSDDNTALASLSYDFEIARVRVPIVSAYDSKASKVPKIGIFVKKLAMTKLVQIMTPSLCLAGSDADPVMRVDCTHADLCRIDVRSGFYATLLPAVDDMLEQFEHANAQRQIASVPTGLRSLSLRSRSSRQTGLQLSAIQSVVTSMQQQQLSSTLEDSGNAAAGSTTQASMVIVYPPTDFEVPLKMARLPCFSVKSRAKNRLFFGRHDILDQIDAALLPGSPADQGVNPAPDNAATPSKVKSFALCGIGGCGKTELAVEYAYSRRSKFDAIFWVSADSKDVLTNDFARIAVDLGLLEASDAQDLLNACDRVNGWLSNPVKSQDGTTNIANDSTWLLIFDNADKVEVLEGFWPYTGFGSVLVTSRDMFAKSQSHYADQGVDLAPFSIPEATEWIRSLKPSHSKAGQDEDLREIALRLGGLPLLITEMSGLMSRLRLSFKDFLRLCDEKDIEHMDWSAEPSSQSAQIFSISAKLGFDGLLARDLALLQMMSLLDPDGIPKEVLDAAVSQKLISDFPRDLTDFMAARAQLQTSSLIGVNEETGSISLHRVVQDAARAKMEGGHLSNVFDATLRAVSAAWPFGKLVDRFSTQRYSACANIFPSVRRIMSAHEHILKHGVGGHPDVAAALYNDAGWYWFERGFPQEAKEFWRMTERVYEQTKSSDTETQHYMLRRANLNSATASMETNDGKDCLTRYQKWLDDSALIIPGTTDPAFKYELACIYNETGVAYAMNSLHETAIDYFIKSIKTFQDLPDYDDVLLNWPEPNLGFMYWIKGQFDEAERVLLEILQVHEDKWGQDDVETFKTGKILYALGNVHTSRGDLSRGDIDAGFSYHRRALTNYRKTLGDKHHRVGDASHRLAAHNIRIQDWQEATTLLDHAIEIFESRPYLRNELARSRHKKAQMYRVMGDDSSADSEFAKAHELWHVLRPGDKRASSELVEADFDELVIFWSR